MLLADCLYEIIFGSANNIIVSYLESVAILINDEDVNISNPLVFSGVDCYSLFFIIGFCGFTVAFGVSLCFSPKTNSLHHEIKLFGSKSLPL